MLGNNQQTEREEISLLELNLRIKDVVSRSFAAPCWVRAEMSDVRLNASGHCYLEFIEKNPTTGQTVAKARGAIWARTFRSIKPYFEQETGQMFTSGIKVLVKVTVEFHELYGYSLSVVDIDPAYTVGDMLRRRMEIVKRLKAEGVFTLNKELPFPTLPVRIALITSPTAAGYEDFMNQLMGNQGGYPFYTRLFPAVMQGDKTEESIITALERIYAHAECFDVVVIIRGGGATSDLNSFDSYLLAANCAQFPLPIITGIGHERDDTVVDMVAHTRMKTPTAVAEFLIAKMDAANLEVESLQQKVVTLADSILQEEKRRLQLMGARFPAVVSGRIERSRSQLQMMGGRLPVAATNLLNRHNNLLSESQIRLRHVIAEKTADAGRFLELTEQYITMVSPQYVLKRGYSLTLKDGKIMKRATSFASGDEITTRFADGEINSKVI